MSWNLNKIKEKVKILKDNEVYRIGDMLTFDKNQKTVKKLLSDLKMRDTFLFQYFLKSKQIPFYRILKEEFTKEKKISRFTIFS